jgi:O-antigen/teichoic acid export membrane protein
MDNTISWIRTSVGKQAGISSGYVIQTAVAGWGSRIFVALCQLLQIRLLSYHLGLDRYAAYTIITGLAGWFALADFGFGRPLQNRISKLRLKGVDTSDIIVSVSICVGIASLLLLLLMTLLSVQIGPFLLRHISGISAQQATVAFAVYAFMGVGVAVSSLIYRILFAEHHGYWVYVLSAAAALSGLAGVYAFFLIRDNPSLISTLLITVSPTVLLPASCLLYRLYVIRCSVARCSLLKFVNLKSTLELGSVAKHFLWFAFVAACVNNIDVVIISQFFSSRDIILYSVSLKLYGLIFTLLANFLQAASPEFTELLLKSEKVRLLKLIALCFGLGALAIVTGSAVLGIFPQAIMNLILPGQNIHLTVGIIAVFSFYWLVRVWCDTFATFIQSSDQMKYLTIVVPIQALLNACFMIVGAKLFGLPGMIIGSSLSFVLTVAWTLPVQAFYMMRAMIPIAIGRSERG